ncbi:hypothetical protein F7725_016234 [Dissostichus mawsoni]|uniref:Uncharacterized protein n=1 Tax=Dissostichus mawsoni TaxID=36200 RepID=A0A7J5Z314_DISMA|nr:hypothetical protein F7725_016234 [Dissostichus mawsoni]
MRKVEMQYGQKTTRWQITLNTRWGKAGGGEEAVGGSMVVVGFSAERIPPGQEGHVTIRLIPDGDAIFVEISRGGVGHLCSTVRAENHQVADQPEHKVGEEAGGGGGGVGVEVERESCGRVHGGRRFSCRENPTWSETEQTSPKRQTMISSGSSSHIQTNNKKSCFEANVFYS